MSKEDTVLESYFVYISNFSHEKAKEVVEKERDVARVSSGSSWSQLVSVLINLSNAEKTYHSLTFLIPRSGSVFLRKEPSLKSVYQSLIVDCRNAMEAGPASERRSELSQVCDDLARIFQVRVRMIDIYERLCNLSQQAFLAEIFSVEVPSLTTILAELKKNQSKMASSWLIVLKYEVGLMLDFLTLILTMQDFNFFDSIMLLQRAGETLNKWDGVVQVNSILFLFTPTYRYIHLLLGKRDKEARLCLQLAACQWICRASALYLVPAAQVLAPLQVLTVFPLHPVRADQHQRNEVPVLQAFNRPDCQALKLSEETRCCICVNFV